MRLRPSKKGILPLFLSLSLDLTASRPLARGGRKRRKKDEAEVKEREGKELPMSVPVFHRAGSRLIAGLHYTSNPAPREAFRLRRHASAQQAGQPEGNTCHYFLFQDMVGVPPLRPREENACRYPPAVCLVLSGTYLPRGEGKKNRAAAQVLSMSFLG